MIAVVAIGLALVIAVMFISSRAVAPATGRDDGLIEAQRDATLLSGAKASSAVPAVIDESYYTSAGARNVPAVVDNSQDTIEHMRGFTTVTGTRLDTAWGAAGPADIFGPMLIDQWVTTHGK